MLHLANGDTLNRKLQAPDNVLARQCSADKAPGKIVDDAYLSALARMPSDRERTQLAAALDPPDPKQLRAAVEVMLTERCARLIDKAGMAELNELAQEFEAAAERKDSIAVVNANLRLHHAINRVADNPEAMHVLGRGRLLIQALRVRFGYGPGRTDTVIAEHRALLRAIVRRDERKAGEIARRHCEGARDELLALLSR